MEDMSEWLTSSNEALTIQLCRTERDQPTGHGDVEEAVEPFHPEFTYPIFGEKEVIFGYKKLKIEYSLTSGSLKQYLNISYGDKIKSEATPADDVEGIFYKFIPSDYTKNKETFQKTVEKEADTFIPPGVKMTSYEPSSMHNNAAASSSKSAANGNGNGEKNGVAEDQIKTEYEIYRCDWKTPGFRDLHRRMQLFILMYIEGGSYIQEDEDQWEFLMLFEKRIDTRVPESPRTTYHFVGYVSAYPFWCYPDMVRMRLSQFVILPPYQGKGHGSRLYNALFDHVLADSNVSELTIEDPSEAFEDLRDRNDLARLRKKLEGSPELKEGAPVDKKWMEAVRKEGKYAKRQFSRLLEMLLLEKQKGDVGMESKAYRLQVKERLYRFNYEILSQITPEERKQKLAETYENVVDDYRRILSSSRMR